MPKLVKNNRWRHPNYKGAFCFKRADSAFVQLSVGSIRRATKILWNDSNKYIALEALTEFYLEIYAPSKKATEYTLYDAMELFLKELSNNVSKATFNRYNYVYKNVFPNDIELDNIMNLKENVIDNFNKAFGNSAPNTKNKAMERVNKLLNYCVDNDLIIKNPITKNLIPKRQTKEVLTYTDNQLEIIQNYFLSVNIQMYYYIEFMLITGFRVGELLNLEWSDVNNNAIILRNTKTKKNRIFPLRPFPKLQMILIELKKINPDKPCNYANKDVLRSALYKSFRIIERKYNIDLSNLSFHNFRKTAINKWRKLGIDLEVRAQIAGHSETVEKQYYLESPDADYFNDYFEKIGMIQN